MKRGTPANVRIVIWIVIGCVECTVYVYVRHTPDLGGGGWVGGGYARIAKGGPSLHCRGVAVPNNEPESHA